MNHDNNQQGLLNPNIYKKIKLLFFSPFLYKFPACTFKSAIYHQYGIADFALNNII